MLPILSAALTGVHSSSDIAVAFDMAIATAFFFAMEYWTFICSARVEKWSPETCLGTFNC